jgi:hypothetical protein
VSIELHPVADVTEFNYRTTFTVPEPIAPDTGRTSTPGKRGTDMTRIGNILGNTRSARRGNQVARWVLEVASKRGDAGFESIDVADYRQPHLDEPLPPSMGQYRNQHPHDWAEFAPGEHQHQALDTLYAGLRAWGGALAPSRTVANAA